MKNKNTIIILVIILIAIIIFFVSMNNKKTQNIVEPTPEELIDQSTQKDEISDIETQINNMDIDSSLENDFKDLNIEIENI